MRSIRRSRQFAATAILVAGLLAGTAAVACDDDEGEASPEAIRAVEDTLRQVVGSDGTNAEFFFAHVTDSLIESALFSTREECEANAVECIGEPLPVTSFSDTEIDGDTATSTALTDFATFELGLVRQDGEWKVDYIQAASDDVPAGATVVDVDLQEFAFVFDPAEVPGDGNVAFHLTNVGDQMHELVLLQVPPGGELEDAIAAVESEEAPPLGAKIYVRPGQSLDMAFDAPLEPGRYAFVCFFPDTDDPEFAGHVEKGMFAEFDVQ